MLRSKSTDASTAVREGRTREGTGLEMPNNHLLRAGNLVSPFVWDLV